jgi:hypothetical protein
VTKLIKVHLRKRLTGSHITKTDENQDTRSALAKAMSTVYSSIFGTTRQAEPNNV